MAYSLPSSFQGGIMGAVDSLKKGTLTQLQTSPVVKPTAVKQTFTPPKPAPVDPNKTPEAFKKRFIEKHGDGTAEDGRKYSQIPANEIVVKVIRKYGDGKTSDGIPYRDFLPRGSEGDSLEYRLKTLEQLYNMPKSEYATTGTIRQATAEENKFATDVTKRQNEGEIMKTIKAPVRGLQSVGQNLAYGTAGVVADVVDTVDGQDKNSLSNQIRRVTEQEQFKSGQLNQNKGFVEGMQQGDLSSVVQSLSEGAAYMATAARIPLYLMALSQGGNMSLEGEQQGQDGFVDKAIGYGTATISSTIDRLSSKNVIDGLMKTGVQKTTATRFVDKMSNYLKTLKPSDLEAGTEVIQQKIENIGRDLMGVKYEEGLKQYFEAGLMGKILGKVGDSGRAGATVTTITPTPKAPKVPKVNSQNVETLKTIKIGKKANNNVTRNQERGYDSYADIASHQEIVPTVDKTGLVRTYEQVSNLEDTLDPINDALTQSIKNEGVLIPLDEFLINSMNEAKQYENEGASYDRYIKQIKSDFEVYKRFTDEQGRIDLSKINEIKKAKYGISNFSDVESDKANKMVGRAAKELVEKYTTGESTKAINRELARWYSARDLLLAMDGKTVKGGRLGKMAARVGGNIIGSYFGPLGAFAGGEISAAVQGQMMKGSLKTPTGSIDSESVLSKIPKKVPPQLPPASQSSSSKTEVQPKQSLPVQESVLPSKTEVKLPKKEVSSKDIKNPNIISKIAKKQETPKLPVKTETPKTPMKSALPMSQKSDVVYSKPAESVNDIRGILKDSGLEQYKNEGGLNRIGQGRISGDFSVRDEIISTKTRISPKHKWHTKSTPTGNMVIDGGDGMQLSDSALSKIKNTLDDNGVKYTVESGRIKIKSGSKSALPLSQKSDVVYSKPTNESIVAKMKGKFGIDDNRLNGIAEGTSSFSKKESVLRNIDYAEINGYITKKEAEQLRTPLLKKWEEFAKNNKKEFEKADKYLQKGMDEGRNAEE